MPFICANTVYESCSDTAIAIYELTVSQLTEVRKAMDSETMYIDCSALSFDINDLPFIDPRQVFSGRIEFVATWYDPE